jgi:hypothetical protein
VATLIPLLRSLGLELTQSKCVVATHVDDQFGPFQEFGFIHAQRGLKLLGAFVAIGDPLEADFLMSETDKMETFFRRTCCVDRQVGYILFRLCGIPMWNHHIRCHHPDASLPVDGLAHECLKVIFGVEAEAECPLFTNLYFTKDALAVVSFADLAPVAHTACRTGVYTMNETSLRSSGNVNALNGTPLTVGSPPQGTPFTNAFCGFAHFSPLA